MAGSVDPEHTALVARSVAIVEGLGCRHRRASLGQRAEARASASGSSGRRRGPTGRSGAARRGPRAARRAARRGARRRSSACRASPPTAPKTSSGTRSASWRDRGRVAGDDEARRALRRRGASTGPPTGRGRRVAPMPAGQAALGERDGEAALGDVVGAREEALAHGLADRRPAPACTCSRSNGGSPSGSASPRSFASSVAASDGAKWPASATASPSCAKPRRRRARRRAARPTMPMTGVG